VSQLCQGDGTTVSMGWNKLGTAMSVLHKSKEY
jgi:hypothetical protein